MRGFYFLLVLLFFSGSLWAQSVSERKCAAQTLHQEKLESDPAYRARYEQIEKRAKQFEQQKQFSRSNASTTIREIPVYVHVIYDENKPQQNISDAQIESQIEVLNQDFRALNSDVVAVPAEFEGLVADYRLIFKLEGVSRKSSSRTTWNSDDKMKSTLTGGVDAITPETHLNIWVCPLADDLLGYAQFPGLRMVTDGVVIGSSFFGSADYDSNNDFYLTAPFNKGRTTTHEIGHYLNLFHIWGDGGCAIDDEVEDTPPAAEANGGCPSFPSKSCATNTAHSSDMFMNYMDYVNDACMFMFSEGQKTRSYSLFEPGGYREGLGTVLDGCDLASPTGFSLLSKTTTSLTLKWDAIPDADSYDVWVDGRLYNSPTNSIRLTNLEKGQIYEIKVAANCLSGGSSAFSDIKSYTTLGCYNGPIELSLTTDEYGSETSWALSYNGTIVQTDSMVYNANTTYTETFDFGNGTYEFEIFDASADGFCCDFGNGSYSLTDSEGTIIASGGDFGNSEWVSFCIKDSKTIDCNAAVAANNGVNTTSSAPALFEFTASEDKEYTISSVGSTTVNTDLAIYSDCATLLATSDDFEDVQAEVSVLLSQNQTIYIHWKETHSADGFDWSITPGGAVQTIDFSALPSMKADDSPIQLSATATSGLPVQFSSSNQQVATVRGAILTIVGGGQTTITATQSGNQGYLAAEEVEQVLTVSKIEQSITITEIPEKFATDDDFRIEAVASSGLELSYEIAGPASISGDTISVHATKTGTVTVTAKQSGNKRYNSATASTSFQVKEGPCFNFDFATLDLSHVNCEGAQDGQVVVEASGAKMPYSYSLDGAAAKETNTFGDLTEGEHTIVVTDAKGCQIDSTFTIKSASAIEITGNVTNSNNSSGNGSVELSVSGGSGVYTYQWSNGADTSTILDLKIGKYTVVVTDENGCSIESVFEVGGVTANDDVREEAFIIFPNPAKDVVTIIHNGKSNLIKIYNASGMLMLDQNISGKESEVDVSNLASGLYFVQLNKERAIQKFWIK